MTIQLLSKRVGILVSDPVQFGHEYLFRLIEPFGTLWSSTCCLSCMFAPGFYTRSRHSLLCCLPLQSGCSKCGPAGRQSIIWRLTSCFSGGRSAVCAGSFLRRAVHGSPDPHGLRSDALGAGKRIGRSTRMCHRAR
jgi:hypothetical protein